MRICAISDLHGHLPTIPDCDVLCIAGDIVELTVQRDYNKAKQWWTVNFINWIDTLPCKKVFIVPGNHDLLLEFEWNKDKCKEFQELLNTLTSNKVEILIDALSEYEGVTFYGTPWIAPIYWQTWAFEDTEHEYDEYVCPYEKIPSCDILITHENPNYNEKLEHYCFGKYKHHFFGHWHNGISYGHLNQYNCSILTDSYLERERPKIVTIEFNKEEHDN